MQHSDSNRSSDVLAGLNHDELLMQDPSADADQPLTSQSALGETLRGAWRNFDYQESKAKVADLIRTHPFQALGLGVGLGLILAKGRK